MESNPTIRFTVSLPQNLLDNLDKNITKQGYSSRSELIRDMIREKMLQEKWDEGGELTGILSLVYDHHHKDLNQKIIDIQHNANVHVVCTTHIHLNHNNCLETIIIQGQSNELRSFTFALSGLKGVSFASLTKIAPF